MRNGVVLCPKCGTPAQVTFFNREKVKCPRNECGYVFHHEETKTEYQRKQMKKEVAKWDEEQTAKKAKKKLMESKQKLMETKIAALKLEAKANPEIRASRYLNYMRNGGFPIRGDIGNGAHIYIIELEEPAEKYLNKHTFPNEEYLQIVEKEDDGFKGYVYVGHTQRKLTDVQSEKVGGDPVVFRFKYKHKKGIQSAKVVEFHSKTDDFETCGREMTDRFGFRNVSIVKPKFGELESEKLESWVGYMLYKLGYWVWGPRAHLPEEREKYGEFLGEGIYI